MPKQIGDPKFIIWLQETIIHYIKHNKRWKQIEG